MSGVLDKSLQQAHDIHKSLNLSFLCKFLLRFHQLSELSEAHIYVKFESSLYSKFLPRVDFSQVSYFILGLDDKKRSNLGFWKKK